MKKEDYLQQAIRVTPENRRQLLKGTPPFFMAMAHAAQQLDDCAMIFAFPDGRVIKFQKTPSQAGPESDRAAIIHIHDWAMVRRTILGGTVGFYESFADDQWTTPDLSECLYLLSNNVSSLKKRMVGNRLFKIAHNIAHFMNRNTKSGSKKNIMAHYDLGNGFYEKWLDRTMTYSSARFTRADMPLDKAQQEKYRSLARQIDLRPDETVLEIGSGWGGFAEFAAKEVGAKVTGLTISREQYDYACARMQREGLNEKVEIKLLDYRDVEGRYDKIASIEMFEAVGKEYWNTYFDKVRQVLKPSGLAGFQIITIRDELYPVYENNVDFIQRYVFPGGMLPSPSVLKSEVERAGMEVKSSLSFGHDYARTLQEWQSKFLENWNQLTPLGFDEGFKKLWRFYLSYCEAGFRSGSTDVVQVTVAKA